MHQLNFWAFKNIVWNSIDDYIFCDLCDVYSCDK
jgi:hypothetical protein